MYDKFSKELSIMSEELIQRNLVAAPEHMGAWEYYNIGATTLKALKEAQIIPQKNYAEFESKKPDALIIEKAHVIATIEYKQPCQLRTKKQVAAAVGQELGTARVLGAKIYIVTDGKKTYWINPLTGNPILSEDGKPLTTEFQRDSDMSIRLIHRILSSIRADNDMLCTPVPVDPLPLARQVWQDLWAVSGATPENCLYTFVEVFIFKYLSDLGVLRGMHTFDHLIAQYGANNDNEVLEVYASSVRPKIKDLFPWNPKDKTTIINGTIFVSKDDKAVDGYAAVFHKILDRFAKFGTLEKIDYDFKSKLFETFLKESISKKNWGQFFTPLKVVQSIAKMAEIRPGMHICDPACGVGKFLLEPILHDLDRYFTVEDGQLKAKIQLSGFDKGFDKDEQKTIILAKANMLIYFSALLRDHAGISAQFSELFNNTFLLQTNSILGTLSQPITDEYDLILTNPPYVMSGSSNLKEEIAKRVDLKSHYSISAMGVEGLFMEWIIRALKPGGKAFIVVPDGIMNRSNDQRLRDFIRTECEIDAVISLPLNTFFTTNKKTYIMALTKKVPVVCEGVTVKEQQTSPIFTYLCSEIGETRDMYRFDLEQNDLAAAADLYCMFRGAKDCFRTDDPRCKIVSIDAFAEGTHWSVERWWTREERIALGIEEEDRSVTPEEMGVMITDITNTLNEYRDMLLSTVQKKKEKLGFRTIYLTDQEKFTLISRGLGKNRTELQQMDTHCCTDIPVYTAAQEPVAYIARIAGKEPIMASEAAPLLSFATNGDGSAGRNFVMHKKPFYLNVDRIAVEIPDSAIDLSYVYTCIFDMKERYRFHHAFKANRHNLANVSLPIPVMENGAFDLQMQKNIALQFELIEQMKGEIQKKRNRIKEVIFHIDLKEYSMRYMPLSDVLDTVKGNSRYTRKYGKDHQGNYPVFAASSTKPLTYLDTYDYDGNYLSWSTNGFAGMVTVLKGQFSINGDRGLLIPKIDHINILYLRYILEPIFRKLAKGRRGDRGEDEFTKLYPSMISDVVVPLPVDTSGTISMEAQNEIAMMYDTMEEYRREIVGKLDALLNQHISY